MQMETPMTQTVPDRISRVIHAIALCATLILPVALFYSRALSDICVSATAALFLVQSALRGDWSWTRRAWVRLAALFWALVVVSSIVHGPAPSVMQSLALVRLFLFVAALEAWVLAEEKARRWLFYVVAGCAVWLALEAWQQYLTGFNVFGDPRWGDGSLTGPFYQPRAGGVFLMVLLPGSLPCVIALLHRPRLAARLAGVLLLIVTVATTVLIGQRMPSVLMLFGLGLTALLVRRLRVAVLVAFATGAVVLAATPIISPPTYQKLVLHFAEQMVHFPESPYGILFTRAVVMVSAHPWLGLGFDGFRDYCGDPAYFHGLPWLGIPDGINGGLEGCNFHPHNNYLLVATAGGVPGLLLFCVIVALWLRRAGAGLDAARDPLQLMLFVTGCVMFWPIASASGMFTFDTAGWVFMNTGWALASARGRTALSPARSPD